LFASSSQEVQLHNPEWPDGQDVYVKGALSWGDRRAIEASLFAVKAQMQDGETTVTTDAEISAMKLTTLVKAITRWTLTDDAGAAVPLTSAAIDDLGSEAAEYIYDQINALYAAQKKTPAETRVFSDAAATA
jgi:hypothetical protein